MSVQVKGSGTIGGLDEGLVVSGIITATTGSFTGNVTVNGLTATSYVSVGDNDTINAGDGNDIKIYHQSSDNNSYIENDTGSLFIRSDASGKDITLQAADMLSFNTNGQYQRLRISDNGQIATRGASGTSFNNAGTGDFGSFFTINGGHTSNQWGILSLEGNSSANGYAVGAIQFINQNNANGSSGANSQSRLLAKIDAHTVTTDSNAGDDSGGFLSFTTKPEAGNPIERLRITSTGDVNIGNDTGKLQLGASQDLQIFHNGSSNRIIAANADLIIQSNAYAIRSENGSSTFLNISSAGLSQFVNSTGGQIHLGGASAHTAKITITDNAGSGNGNFLFGGPSSTHLKVASGGNILIGDGSTYSPGAHVHIHGGTTGLAQLRVQNHTSIGSFSGNYGSEFRHAFSSTNHCMLIHAEESNDARRTLDISDSNGIFGRFVNGKTGLGRDSSGNVSTRGVLEICAPFDDVSDNDGSADLGTNGHDALIINISGPGAASGKNVGSISWGGGRRRAAIMAEYQNTDSDYLALAFFTRGTDGAGDFYKSFIINHNGSAGLHGSLSQNTSDDRLKKDKVEIENALDKVNSLSSFTHKWNEIAVRAGLEENKTEIGLSAQEVQGLYPSLVNVNNTMIDPDNPSTEYLTIHYEKVVPLLVASIKELTSEINSLKSRLSSLEGS